MRRPSAPWLLTLALTAGLAAGCEDATPPPTTPTEPVPIVTDTFSGTLTRNGAVTFTFATQGAGGVIATLRSVEPSPAVAIGVSLGTWNGTTCQIVLANDNVLPGNSVIGTVSGIGTLCVRVYDPGRLTDPITFEITVAHP